MPPPSRPSRSLSARLRSGSRLTRSVSRGGGRSFIGAISRGRSRLIGTGRSSRLSLSSGATPPAELTTAAPVVTAVASDATAVAAAMVVAVSVMPSVALSAEVGATSGVVGTAAAAEVDAEAAAFPLCPCPPSCTCLSWVVSPAAASPPASLSACMAAARHWSLSSVARSLSGLDTDEVIRRAKRRITAWASVPLRSVNVTRQLARVLRAPAASVSAAVSIAAASMTRLTPTVAATTSASHAALAA